MKVGAGGNSVWRPHAYYPQGNNQCIEAYDYQARLSFNGKIGEVERAKKTEQVVGIMNDEGVERLNRPSVLPLPLFC